MKKIISLLLTICMLISAVIIPTYAVESNSDSSGRKTSNDGLWEYLEYNRSGYSSGYKVVNYLGTETDITLPEEIDGVPINSVNLDPRSTIEHVTIPITYIDFDLGSFSHCTNLKSVTFSRDYEVGAIKYFGDMIFALCENLETVVLPNDISFRSTADFSTPNTKLPADTFNGCKKLKNVVFPDNIKELGGQCFYGCSSLTDIVVPEGVTSIGEYVFCGCSSLKTITLPKTLESMEGNAFCSWTTTDGFKLEIPETAIFYVSRDSKAYDILTSLFKTANFTNLILFDNTTSEIKGDVNGDGTLDINDVTLLQKWIAKFYDFDISNADFDNNGKININDATYMQRSIAHIG